MTARNCPLCSASRRSDANRLVNSSGNRRESDRKIFFGQSFGRDDCIFQRLQSLIPLFLGDFKSFPRIRVSIGPVAEAFLNSLARSLGNGV